jgi:hypothetical protein
MSSAIHNLQKAILDGKQSVTQLLRHAKLIAAKLNVEDVERWVDWELNGYPDGVEPPKYRWVTTHSLEARNPVHGWLFVTYIDFNVPSSQSIADIQTFSEGEQVAFPNPKPDFFGLKDTFGEPCNYPQRITIAGTQYKRIIEAVTNELLRWTTELEKRGITGEDMHFNEKEKQSAGDTIFNIATVHGAAGNITNSQVTVYDYSSVQQLLIDHKIPKQDRRELEDIMDELKDAPPEKRPSLIERGEKWILKHKELLGAGAEAVGKAIGAAMKH